ncbi:MAG: HEPN domain-containing protein [Candidatus Poribacteria bacterium]|nr:HEPN domain-containing protein [Candidatus Poribacteria bacterium]
MVTRQEIQTITDDIVREFAPLQVILFGSYAYGTPTEDSDVDLLVVMDIPKSEFRNKAIEIRQRVSYHFGLDLLVRSPEEIAYRVSYNDWFLREITEKGKLLHGSDAHYRMSHPADPPNAVKHEEDCMNPLTLEWIEKAEEDYNAAKWLQQSPNPVHNSICFHVQQCIEKYLKAWLQEANISAPRTHNLEELLALILPTLPEWSHWQSDFKIITEYAVDPRYPGGSATADDTQHAMLMCDEVRQAVRTQLEPVNPVIERKQKL